MHELPGETDSKQAEQPGVGAGGVPAPDGEDVQPFRCSSPEIDLLQTRCRRRGADRCATTKISWNLPPLRSLNLLPEASDTRSVAAIPLAYCDDCMGIDLDKVTYHDGLWVPLANIKTCPMCTFFYASIVRLFPCSNSKKDILRTRCGQNGANWRTSRAMSWDLPLLRDSNLLPKKRVYPCLADYRFISSWLADCVESHGDHCFNSRLDHDPVPGLQFIDCVARRIVPASEAGHEAYLTLSYVWGAPSEHVEEIGSVSTLPIHLPKVIEDSIRVVKELGFRYLWVDRYCIPQADSRAKHTQIQLMGAIYARSAITIIAAAGEDADYGLPGVGLRARNPQLRTDSASVCTGDRLPRPLMVYHRPKEDIESTLWSTRGWTYQEALLSKRRLVFTDNQVFFQCQRMLCEESQMSSAGGSGRTEEPGKFVFPPAADFRNIETAWARISEFVNRNLSFDRDALDAISGILNIYCVLIKGLLWMGSWSHRAIGLPKVESSPTRLERLRRSEFPSWTWVGWKGTSEYELCAGGTSYFGFCGWKCAIRAVYEDRQMSLAWEEDAERILENSAVGLNPKFLDIKGTCFDVSLAWDPKEGEWAYTEPLALKLKKCRILQRYIPPNTLEEGEGKVHKLVALLLSNFVSEIKGGGRIHEMKVLLLQPVECNAGRWIYERVTCDSIFEIGLEERELRMG
ncbi:heterokaryon incompatibility protein-domain-containing protein [Pseudoneurospora amorphoporcata]|uniref:Heterokaryon incompatibility protein-domain-containing protein n=1 Tax=Pseudoneurospora amorphoporcata TaxID=241081 RepID=A0AAN6NXK6_9PEZI|nr:heterokaryon incompatibility protein-domain-containing protein [Pseudoneurospora amorphoporcata]